MTYDLWVSVRQVNDPEDFFKCYTSEAQCPSDNISHMCLFIIRCSQLEAGYQCGILVIDLRYVRTWSSLSASTLCSLNKTKQKKEIQQKALTERASC